MADYGPILRHELVLVTEYYRQIGGIRKINFISKILYFYCVR